MFSRYACFYVCLSANIGNGIRYPSVLNLEFLLEFSSQLPHDGGAFYTTDTMESARPYYSESWAPILYAATLWLNAREFKIDDSNTKKSDGTNNNSTASTTTSSSKPAKNVERFHLLFGKI